MRLLGFEIKKYKKEKHPLYERCDYCPYWKFQKQEYWVWADEYVSQGWCKKLNQLTNLKDKSPC